jgi:flagellin
LFVDNIKAPQRAIPDLNGTSISTITNASNSITEIDLNIQSVAYARSSLGASMNRIIHATDYLAETALQLANSRSQMIEIDYAETSSDLARVQSLDIAATYVLKQLRQNSQNSINMIRSNDNLFKS